MTLKLARIFSAELEGIDAKLIEIEIDINVALHSFTIVGLADKALSEAKERVNSALKNSGFKPPTKENRKITVNLAPANIQKTGSQYDLGIAVGYLLATNQIKNFDSKNKLFIGELALDGSLRPVYGALNISCLGEKLGFDEIILPKANSKEASLVSGIKIIPAQNLEEVLNHLEGRIIIPSSPKTSIEELNNTEDFEFDFEDIKGQESAKRALIIAASGNHNLLMVGPPGSGKTMLAKALNSILPALKSEEIIEISKIWSAAGFLKEQFGLNSRPFRQPHHSASATAVIGGGTNPKPGEISLAHRGVLFFDELPEFHRDVLEALRQPLESGKISISRVKNNLTFPARFQFITAMNPCPCGFYNDPEKECRCTAYEVFRYQKKISGPLIDRIDLQVSVPRLKIEQLKSTQKTKSKEIKNLITEARETQKNRFKKADLNILTNAEMTSKHCEQMIRLNKEADDFIKQVFDKSLLSARGYFRILKVSQTIADLEKSQIIELPHIAEAFQYRLKNNIASNL